MVKVGDVYRKSGPCDWVKAERKACANICDETHVEPGDLQVESCHEAATKIRARSNS